ncbi:MAG: MerR family transcriptional regulator [Clostridiales bacterium]|nr:MerR family transcriptional regulator [Clostridiales bacterium]
MEYTVRKLATLAGVSPRTLRFYDQSGLLAPARINSSGYRIYGQAEVRRLQQILFYRELGMGLEEIKRTLDSDDFQQLAALQEHLKALLARQAQTARLIETVRKTIEHEKGGITMTDAERFEGFKEKLVRENEEKYGAEIREKYGEETVDASNARMMKLSREEYEEMQNLGTELIRKLEAAVKAGDDPAGEAGREIAGMHRKWLGYTWSKYSPQAHLGLGDLYVADERFTAYYDREIPGCAQFLRDAIHFWAK